MQQSIWIVCAKFKFDPLSRFCTGARQVFTTQKLFPNEIPQTWKLQHEILFKHIFWSNYHLPNFFWNLWRQTNRYPCKKVSIWTPSGYFPFFISFFCWNEINKKSSREDTEKIRSSTSAWNFIKKETLPLVFSCEFYEISKNTCSNRKPPMAASERWKIVKPITLQGQRHLFYTNYWK